MGKIIILLGLCFGINLSLYSQDIKLSDSELTLLLCTEWEIDYALAEGMKIKQMPGATDFNYNFHTDGNYDLINDDGTIDTGTWKYNTEKKYVDLTLNGQVNTRIKSINKGKLIITMVSGPNDPPGLPNVEIHFKPI